MIYSYTDRLKCISLALSASLNFKQTVNNKMQENLL
jgi:hypothetical protein